MELDTRCVMCNRMDEDGAHLFLRCKNAKKLWREVGLEEIRERLAQSLSAEDFICKVLELDKKYLLRVCVLLYFWWRERNNVREGESMRNVTALSLMIQTYSDELLKEQQIHLGPSQRQEKRWKRPSEGVLKINVDAAFKPDTGQGGWGAVIRNAEGEVVRAGAGCLNHVMDALHAEMLAAREGVRLAAEAGMGQVILETDAMLVKLALQDDSFRLSALGGIIWEIKTMAESSFNSISVIHCCRSCNQVAHGLAAIGCNCLVGSSLYWDSVPPEVVDLVAGDSAVPLV